MIDATPARAEDPMTQPFRIETDSLGGVEVMSEALWGAQTQRSLQNFAISDERIPLEIIQALAWIKRSCATVNGLHALLSPQQVELICTAADAIAAGQHNDQFPLRVWQTGSGTQTNMNINEVISNLAVAGLGRTDLGSHRPGPSQRPRQPLPINQRRVSGRHPCGSRGGQTTE